jgi:hypothetical protein
VNGFWWIRNGVSECPKVRDAQNGELNQDEETCNTRKGTSKLFYHPTNRRESLTITTNGLVFGIPSAIIGVRFRIE